MDMQLIKYILVPIVGAVIGYVTNWIAVKMLFRPHHEVRVCGLKLPFTPGVIPKGQGRLARAVGRAVEEQLLTREVMEEVLLSEETKGKLKAGVEAWAAAKETSGQTAGDALVQLVGEAEAEDLIDDAEEGAADLIFSKLLELDVGTLLSEKVLETAKEKLSESMFGMMLGGSFLEPIAAQVGEKINEYIAQNGQSAIEKIVYAESETLQEKPVSEFVAALAERGVSLPDVAVRLYEGLVREKLPEMLRALNLRGIVERRINAMEVSEVEELMLSIMKKELGAVVNLGALIGFVLGLINVGILCI